MTISLEKIFANDSKVVRVDGYAVHFTPACLKQAWRDRLSPFRVAEIAARKGIGRHVFGGLEVGIFGHERVSALVVEEVTLRWLNPAERAAWAQA